jgi:hypothetical protein
MEQIPIRRVCLITIAFAHLNDVRKCGLLGHIHNFALDPTTARPETNQPNALSSIRKAT